MKRSGLLGKMMTRRFGQHAEFVKRDLLAHGWNPDEWDYASALYMGMKWNGPTGRRFASLREIYGNSIGGYLIKNTLKAAVLTPGKIYGIWNIYDLRRLPQVQRALTMDPSVDYFMEEHNQKFYGVKEGKLYVYDNLYDDVESLGPIEPALGEVFDELAEIFLAEDDD